MSLFFILYTSIYQYIHRRTVPTMLSVDENGSKTIPSVISFIPSNDSPQSSNNELSLPPWTTSTSSTEEQSPNINLQWPSSQYTIHTGQKAIQYENQYPKSTYRNVKRIIGTGGTMANLANGVVPNLYIDSINGHVNSGMNGSGIGGSGISNGGNGELDILFNMLEDSDKSSNKKKGKKKKKQKNKWKKRKENELPKLHKQLVDAKDDPALLSCNLGSGEGGW